MLKLRYMYTSLRKKKEIENVFKNGRTKRSRFFVLKFIKSKEKEARVVMVVSKKIHKSAVVRNRNRRKIREAIRFLKIRVGFDYAILPLKDISKVKQSEIENDLNKII